MLDKVAVIGAGSWGTTVAAVAACSAPTVLWARRPALALTLEQTHENPDYLPGVVLPDDAAGHVLSARRRRRAARWW